MKTIIPAKEVDVCDICHREVDLFDHCLFCGKEFCYSCAGRVIPGCIHEVNICKNCQKEPKVLEIIAKHAPLIKAAIVARDEEIAHANRH